MLFVLSARREHSLCSESCHCHESEWRRGLAVMICAGKLVSQASLDSVEAAASPSVTKDDWCSLKSLVSVTENFGTRVR